MGIPTSSNDHVKKHQQNSCFEIGTAYANFYFVARNNIGSRRQQRPEKVACKNSQPLRVQNYRSRLGHRSDNPSLGCPPDIILMDVYSPEMTGDEISARLKANPATRDIPVVFTTGLLVEVLKDRAPV